MASPPKKEWKEEYEGKGKEQVNLVSPKTATPLTFVIRAFEEDVDSSLKVEVVGSGNATEEDEGELCIVCDRHSFKNALAPENGDNSTLGTSFTPVPSKSSEMASKNLQQLDKLVSPRENAPTKLSPSMLRGQALKSFENVDSSKSLENMHDSGIFGSFHTALPDIRDSTSHKQVEENGSTKLVALPYKSAPTVNVVDTSSSSKNNVPTPSVKDADSTIIKSVVQPPQEKRQAFQMNAHEDYLDVDDDDYSTGIGFTTVGQRREKLDNCVAGSKSSAAEAVVVKRPPTLCAVKRISSSVLNQKPDMGTYEGSTAVEENTGITFPVAQVATSSIRCVAGSKNSAAEALVVKRPELGTSDGSEVVEKNTGITFAVAQVATSSVQATFLVSQSTSTTTKDVASKESNATSLMLNFGEKVVPAKQPDAAAHMFGFAFTNVGVEEVPAFIGSSGVKFGTNSDQKLENSSSELEKNAAFLHSKDGDSWMPLVTSQSNKDGDEDGVSLEDSCSNSLSLKEERYYGDEVVLVEHTTIRRQNFIIDEQEIGNIERRENITNHEKVRPVIAAIDTGVNANHECFQDGNIPSIITDDKWRGGMLKIPNKRKVLALRNYVQLGKPIVSSNLNDVNYPEDLNGHGTACASIAAATCTNLEWLGFSGIPSTFIQGANPNARVASYKVRGNKVISMDNEGIHVLKEAILAAIKQAIVDKVNVIYVSLATKTLNTSKTCFKEAYFDDVLNYGAYLAFKQNIVLCKSAGNDGPDFNSLSGGLAPWIITVGSSTSGSRFITNIELGNTVKLKGFNSFLDKDGHHYELIHCSKCFKRKDKGSGDPKGVDTKGKGKENELEIDPRGKGNGKGKSADEEIQSPKVKEEEIDSKIVQGKIVIWEEQKKCPIEKLLHAQAAGILIDDYDDEFRCHGLRKPVVYVNKDDMNRICDYLGSCRRLSNMNPTAKFFKSIYEENEDINKLSYKSSRGPNTYDQYILKPDICAPGENILCANKWNQEDMYGSYSIMSGTSMSNAMVAGVISYIMSRRNWEPGRIKSAIMTTASSMQKKPRSTIMGCGAGCINPSKALDPGLVYDVTWQDFRRYMLSRKVDKDSLSSKGEDISGEEIHGRNLNLPSFSLMVESGTCCSFERTLTNVGPKLRCTYKSDILVTPAECPAHIGIFVEPKTLEFNNIEEKKDFKLIISSSSELERLAYARLVWTEQQSQEPHTVSSPIVMWSSKSLKGKEKVPPMLPKKRSAKEVAVQTSKQLKRG